MLDNDADVTLNGFQKSNCLHDACSNGNEKIIKILIKYKAEINSKNQDDFTPLIYASVQGKTIQNY